ncbi:hypothetical protein LR007_03040 [candidate division NPL-UPA2 bacterium]|nr:hypothetical protein [candidate division NPL-UPA2 bacterium]
MEKEGKNNFELAVYWFERAAEHPPYPWYVDHLIGHALGKRAEQARMAGQVEKEIEFKRRALLKWEENIKKISG